LLVWFGLLHPLGNIPPYGSLLCPCGNHDDDDHHHHHQQQQQQRSSQAMAQCAMVVAVAQACIVYSSNNWFKL
jgi:hypothetical protein